MFRFIITLFIAISVGYAAYRVKIPGGFMVGAVLGSAVLSIFTGVAYMPGWTKIAAQVTAGAFIGCGIGKSDLAGFRSLLRPILTLLSMMLALNLLMGYLVYRFSPLDAVTAFMCAVPGGMSDIPIIAAEMGADAAKVTAVQFLRMVAGIAIFPSVIRAMTRGEPQPQPADAPVADSALAESSKPRQSFFLTLLVATAGGLLGRALGIPAGTLAFAVIASVLFKLTTDRAVLPMWAKRMAQVLSGAYIGSSISAPDLIEMRQVLVPALLILAGYAVNCFLTGLLLHRGCHFTRREGMLAATPAGASDMALISADLGVTSPNLVVMQTLRLLAVVIIFPQVIHLVLLLLH